MHTEKNATYERAWLQQLLQEYEAINWQYTLGLKTPCFELTESLSVAGSWHCAGRTLKMARWLLTDHHWSVVRLVLKHEMAHQYVSEILKADVEVAHGQAFQRACDRLGLLNVEFRSGSGHVPRDIIVNDQRSNGHQKKIAKLFALAESGNVHEAKLALQKANELICKYNIVRLRAKENSVYDTVVINSGKKRISAIKRALAAILNDFFFVNIVYSQIYDQHNLESYRTIELTGESENLKIAKYVYRFVEKKLDSLWEQFRLENKAPGKEKRSFVLGVLQGFRVRLQREEEERLASQEGSSCALIHLGDSGLEIYQKARYPRLRKMGRKRPKVYTRSYESGKEKGENLIVHRGISSYREHCDTKLLE